MKCPENCKKCEEGDKFSFLKCLNGQCESPYTLLDGLCTMKACTSIANCEECSSDPSFCELCSPFFYLLERSCSCNKILI